MDNEKALSVLKQVLDAATKSGLFENVDATFIAAQSFNHIQRQLLKEDNLVENANGIDS